MLLACEKCMGLGGNVLCALFWGVMHLRIAGLLSVIGY